MLFKELEGILCSNILTLYDIINDTEEIYEINDFNRTYKRISTDKNPFIEYKDRKVEGIYQDDEEGICIDIK